MIRRPATRGAGFRVTALAAALALLGLAVWANRPLGLALTGARPPSARWVAAGDAQDPPTAAPGEPSAEPLEPTEEPPTPDPPTPGPTPTPSRCRDGLPAPRVFWTVFAQPASLGSLPRMWVPFHRNGGPYASAWVKARYGHDWYTARIDASGRLERDGHPPWPRPDLIQFAGAGVQASRTANPMCPGIHDPTRPPCYAEMVYPLVFLDRLAEGGPYLQRLYFWIPTSQIHADAEGYPSRLRIGVACETDRLCDPGVPCVRMESGRPVYLSVGGCAAAAQRVDTCYAAFTGPTRD